MDARRATLAFVFGPHSLGGKAGDREALVTAVIDAERHAAGVCRSLKTGVLDASTHLLRALFARDPSRPVDDVFEQSLTIVYRLLFLFFAEARALVPALASDLSRQLQRRVAAQCRDGLQPRRALGWSACRDPARARRRADRRAQGHSLQRTAVRTCANAARGTARARRSGGR
jgi:hypothetical protein